MVWGVLGISMGGEFEGGRMDGEGMVGDEMPRTMSRWEPSA